MSTVGGAIGPTHNPQPGGLGAVIGQEFVRSYHLCMHNFCDAQRMVT